MSKQFEVGDLVSVDFTGRIESISISKDYKTQKEVFIYEVCSTEKPFEISRVTVSRLAHLPMPEDFTKKI